MPERIGVVGATGAVGAVTLDVLRQRGHDDVRVFASARSAGTRLGSLTVEEATPEVLGRGDVDIFLFSVGTSASRELVPHAVRGGATAIDKSAAYRLEPGVPLVVPEVNAERAFEHRGILANPNCCTIPLTCVLKPLHDAGRARARAGRDLPVGFGRRSAVDGAAPQRAAGRARPADGLGLRRRRVRRGDEAPRRDTQDPGAAGAADPGDVRAGSGAGRARRSDLDRARGRPSARARARAARRRSVRSASTSSRRRARQPGATTCSWAASVATRRSSGAWRSSSPATTCARARR